MAQEKGPPSEVQPSTTPAWGIADRRVVSNRFNPSLIESFFSL